MATRGVTPESGGHGAALAAFLAAGIGASALGLIVLLNEAGVLSPPALYAPAGGVTGRTTLAVFLWLIAWVVLHRRWKEGRIEARKIFPIALLLIGLGVLLTLPPVWELV